MKAEEIFAKGLGLESPWEIKNVEYVEEPGFSSSLHVYVDFPNGSTFTNDAGEPCQCYDTEMRTWRHTNFFQHRCYLHCRVPRIIMSDGKPRVVDLPWANSGSGFTLVFEP